MGDKPTPSLEFNSKEEFRAACHEMAMRLHYLNRVAMGEKKFTVDIAEMLNGLGRVFDDYYKDTDIQAAFGDGWEVGKLNEDERRAYLFSLIYDAK